MSDNITQPQSTVTEVQALDPAQPAGIPPRPPSSGAARTSSGNRGSGKWTMQPPPSASQHNAVRAEPQVAAGGVPVLRPPPPAGAKRPSSSGGSPAATSASTPRQAPSLTYLTPPTQDPGGTEPLEGFALPNTPTSAHATPSTGAAAVEKGSSGRIKALRSAVLKPSSLKADRAAAAPTSSADEAPGSARAASEGPGSGLLSSSAPEGAEGEGGTDSPLAMAASTAKSTKGRGVAFAGAPEVQTLRDAAEDKVNGAVDAAKEAGAKAADEQAKKVAKMAKVARMRATRFAKQQVQATARQVRPARHDACAGASRGGEASQGAPGVTCATMVLPTPAQFTAQLSLVVKLVVFLALNAGLVSARCPAARVPWHVHATGTEKTRAASTCCPRPQLIFLFVLSRFQYRHLTCTVVRRCGEAAEPQST